MKKNLLKGILIFSITVHIVLAIDISIIMGK
jgi:hypothetical protein